MNDERDDEGLSDEILSRAYRSAATEEPPLALDAAILAAARREAASRPSVRSRPWWRRALAPAGILATLALTVSLALMVEREQREDLPAASPAPEQAKPAAEPAAQSAAPAGAAATRELRSSSGHVLDDQQNEAPAAASAPPAILRKAAPAPSYGELVPAPAGAAAEPERLRAAPSASRREADAAEKPAATPEQWIEDIRRLRREGRESDATAQLAAFRRAHPDYRLPEDLQVP